MLVAAFFIAGACLAYTYQAQLIPLLLNPLGGETLVYLNPAGGFSFIFLISIYAGMALAFPVLIQQLYAFLRPALPSTAHKKSPIIIISSFLLLIAGIVFGYMIAVPNALNFLYGFADQYVEASLTAESYLNFIIAYTIGIGIVFQVPLLLLLINSIKPLTPGGLMRSERWVILLAFIVAAIITPTPDPVNQAIIAVPVIAVYQIGVVAVIISIARRKSLAKKQVKTAVRARITPSGPTEHNPAPNHIPAHEMPFVATLETHALLTPELARDLDVEIEAALAEKARSTEGQLQNVELEFEEEESVKALPIIDLTEAQETELEQALVAAAETESPDLAAELEEELAAQAILTQAVAQDFEPILKAELSPLTPEVAEVDLVEETARQTITPILAATPSQITPPAQPKLRPIDGFGARRPLSSPAMSRPVHTPSPQATTRVQKTAPPRGLYIDGFIAGNNAAA